MNERQVANKALELADKLVKDIELERQDFWAEDSGWCDTLEQAADMLRSQEKYINLLHKLLNANNIGAGRNLTTGAIIPFEVEDERK